MTIELSPQVERIVREAVTVWQVLQCEGADSALRLEAIQRLKTFGKTHGLSLGEITIRELRDEARP